MKKIIILILFIPNLISSQNLFSNPSFESVSTLAATFPFVSFPSSTSQMPFCADWDDDQGSITSNIGQTAVIHSPDWVDTRPGFLRLLNTPANSGNKFVGMFFGEMMEQKLSSKLKPCKRYKVSMFVQTKSVIPVFSSNQQGNVFFGATGTNIKVMLSSSKIKYKNKPVDVAWTQSNFLPKTKEPLITVTIPTGNEEILNWKEISAEFTAPSIEDVNWIGIETDLGDGAATLIDDVKLEEIPISQSNCLKCRVEEGEILTTVSNLGALGDIGALAFQNNGNVKQIMVKQGYNILGQNYGEMLFSVTNPECTVKWDGFIQGTNTPFTDIAGSYFFDIEAVNDCGCKRGTFQAVFTASPQPYSLWVRHDNTSRPNKINPLVNCCREDITLDVNTYDASVCRTLEQNFSASGNQFHLQGPITFKSKNSITVTSGIKLKGAITFKATNNIVISKGVTLTGPAMTFIGKNIIISSGVLRGGIDLKTEITPVDCDQLLRSNDLDENINYSEENINYSKADLIADEDSASNFGISPNPTNNILTFSSNSEISEGTVLSIYDLQGKILTNRTISIPSRNIYFDVSEFNNGIYFLKVTDKAVSETLKFIKQ